MIQNYGRGIMVNGWVSGKEHISLRILNVKKKDVVKLIQLNIKKYYNQFV